ncbi:gamma-glutamyltransferase [Candidatus Leptofilum sp.]|uniref:gamma-glutamyltransferase n=1 Tax=Candidatus Leptofilum sp. TaxID=3241576 RepID=UPI003B5BE43D
MNFENFQFPSRRSNIITHNGLVATSQPLAAQAGLDVLKAGGNALDAAIATVATLCVVEPCSTGIGGDAFALIWQADEQKLYGLNASGPAPQALTANLVCSQGHEQFPAIGGLAVTVPGSLRGWELALERFGSLGLDTLLQRAITYAEGGFPVSQRIARAWKNSTEKMNRLPDSKRVWLPNGRSPRAAELFQNPEFARTLQTIAENGVDAFYRGDIGRQIAEAVQADGGVLTQDDLISYQAEWVEPISVAYGDGYAFHEIPPNGQGLTALLALNIAKQFDLPVLGYGTADYYHALIEAMKLAFADAHAYIGDPRQAELPIEALLSDSYTRSRTGLIQPDNTLQPMPGSPQTHGDTVYLTVADGRGNMVSWIQSLYMGFGSGITAGNTGVQLQNRGANFSLEPGHPNEAAPSKRPYHTIIPGFITKDGQAWSSFGVMGGFMQPQGHLQVGLNLVEFGMDPQTALDAPRFNWLKDKQVALETAVSDDIRQVLQQRGHDLWEKGKPLHYGGGQVIVRHPENGVLIGGSEPRNDGTAVGY